jgi:hypothetical protein
MGAVKPVGNAKQGGKFTDERQFFGADLGITDMLELEMA